MPADTRSPDATKIRRTEPETSGWIVDERSERSVAMNSEARSTGFARREMTDTVAGGSAGGPPAGFALLRPQPAAASARPAAASALSFIW